MIEEKTTMIESRNFRGMKKYEALLYTICYVDDYNELSDQEWIGCLGVACIISFVEGVSANMFSLSKHLEIPYNNLDLQLAFERLKVNGIFSNKYNAKKDPYLTGNAPSSKWRTSAENERNAWCTIAGVASGLSGIKEELKKELNKEVKENK